MTIQLLPKKPRKKKKENVNCCYQQRQTWKYYNADFEGNQDHHDDLLHVLCAPLCFSTDSKLKGRLNDIGRDVMT